MSEQVTLGERNLASPADELARRSQGLKVTTASCVRPALPHNPLFFGPGTTGCVLSYAIGHTEGAQSVPALGYEDRAAYLITNYNRQRK